MDSTATRSPPTSRAIDARSSVEVTTFNLPSACAGAAVATISEAASAARDVMYFMMTLRTDARRARRWQIGTGRGIRWPTPPPHTACGGTCLLYTSDAADERSSVDLGG